MPLRGRGAITKEERAAILAKARRPSWQRKGLGRVQRIVRFIQSLPVTKGHLKGRKMRVHREQRRFLQAVYGEGREVSLAVLSAPRGNGKTGFTAALELAHLLGPEAIERGACYSAAVDRGQASLLFAEMRAIILAVPELAARTNIVRHFKTIEVLTGPGAGSIYEALSADAGRSMGLAPSFWAYDELAQTKDRELFAALETAMGKQPGAMGIVISTQAPDDQHLLSELIDDGLTGIDQSVYVQLHAAPDDADPFDQEVWKGCNFGLGTFLSRDDFETQAARAKRMPSNMASFRNFRLNQRVASEGRLISSDDWEACRGEIDVEGLRGRKAWGALDLSSTTDLTALTLVFEPDAPGRPAPVLAWHWMPAGKIEEMAHADHKTYGLWRDQGWIQTCPGRVIDKRFVAVRLAEIASLYDLELLGFDDWRFSDLLVILYGEGIELPLKAMRQGFKTMGPCVDALEGAVVEREIVHNGNPVLKMCVANAVAVQDAAGNRKVDKARSRARVDSAVTTAMALGLRATTKPGDDAGEFKPDDVAAMFTGKVAPMVRRRRADAEPTAA